MGKKNPFPQALPWQLFVHSIFAKSSKDFKGSTLKRETTQEEDEDESC